MSFSLPDLLGLLASGKVINDNWRGGQSSIVEKLPQNIRIPYEGIRQNFPIDSKPVKATADIVEIIAGETVGHRVLVGGFLTIADGRIFQVVIRDKNRNKVYPLSNSDSLGKPLFGELHLTKTDALSISYSAGAAASEVQGFLSFYDTA